MGLGILDDNKLDHVPGTVLLNEEAAHSERITQGLKHDKGRNEHIVLVPQPSEDPNDPLNWSAWKKERVLLILCFGAALCASTNSAFLNSNYFLMSTEIHVPLPEVVKVSGWNLLAAGCIGPFVSAASRKYGKRPVYLASTLFCIIGTAVGESKVSYEYLRASRILTGFAISAYESIIVSTIGDIYFVHQRGLRIALVSLVLNAGSTMATIICGQVFQNMGWLWLFHLYQIFLVVQFILMFLFCPETMYLRDARYDTDTVINEKLEDLVEIEQRHKEDVREEDSQGDSGRRNTYIPPKKTFIQDLSVWTGVYSQENILKFLVAPFITLLNPLALFSTIVSGLLTAWFVGSSLIKALVFSGPPWFFSPAQIGYVGAGAFIGTVIGSLICGLTGDAAIKYLTRLNKGIYEPEFRLVYMPLACACYGPGMFFFGYALKHGYKAELCAFLQGLLLVGVQLGIYSTFSYALDSFRNRSNELFVMNMFFKNFMFYGLANYANPWVIKSGPEPIMFVFGATAIFMAVLAIPVYIFGKRMRSWTARHDFFTLLKFEVHGHANEVE